jgi:hypothetical protein
VGNLQTAYITKMGRYAEASIEGKQQWQVEEVY